MKYALSLLVAFLAVAGFTDKKPAYRLFNKEGKQTDYERMMKEICKADIIVFG